METVTRKQLYQMIAKLGLLDREWRFDMYSSGLIDYRHDLPGDKYAVLTIDSPDFFDALEKGKSLLNKIDTTVITFAIHYPDDFLKMKVYQYCAEIIPEDFEYEYSLN